MDVIDIDDAIFFAKDLKKRFRLMVSCGLSDGLGDDYSNLD